MNWIMKGGSTTATLNDNGQGYENDNDDDDDHDDHEEEEEENDDDDYDDYDVDMMTIMKTVNVDATLSRLNPV